MKRGKIMLFFYHAYLLEQIKVLLFTAPAVLFAVVCHEYSHGKVSDILGDPTPRDSGRLTFNPFKHLDLIGTICMLFFRVGWAKPVPINPNYYKNQRKGIILVSLAGPAANFLAAFLCVTVEGLLIKYGSVSSHIVIGLALLMEYSTKVNIGLGIFNLIPIPPLDGSKILGEMAYSVQRFYWKWTAYWRWILLLLVITGGLSRSLSIFSGAIFEWMWNTVVRILKIYISSKITVI